MSDYGDISIDLSKILRRGEIESDTTFAATPEPPPTADAAVARSSTA
jgi:hypothetical protein